MATRKTSISPASSPPDAKEAEYDSRIFAIMEIAHEMRRMMVDAIEELGRRRHLTERRLVILDAIFHGIDRPLRLARALNVLPSTISAETAKLAALGLIDREKIAGGGRVVRLTLTPDGAAVQCELITILNDLLVPAVNTLPPEELAAYIATGRKIVDRIGPHAQSQAGAPLPAGAPSR